MAKKKDTVVPAPSAEVPAGKKKKVSGRSKKVVAENVTAEKKTPARRTRKESEVERLKAELERAQQRIGELTNERDNALTQVAILKKELEESATPFVADSLPVIPEDKTPYWYVRAALGAEKFTVMGTVWCDGFWDRTRLLDFNLFLDEKSAVASCQQKQQMYDLLWPR